MCASFSFTGFLIHNEFRKIFNTSILHLCEAHDFTFKKYEIKYNSVERSLFFELLKSENTFVLPSHWLIDWLGIKIIGWGSNAILTLVSLHMTSFLPLLFLLYFFLSMKFRNVMIISFDKGLLLSFCHAFEWTFTSRNTLQGLEMFLYYLFSDFYPLNSLLSRPEIPFIWILTA